MVDGTNFVLVNIYNPNTETKQVTTLLDLGKMLETIKEMSDKDIVLAGNFNLFFDTFLDSYGGKPNWKRNLLPNLLNLRKSLICVTFGEKETLKPKYILFDRTMFLV